MGDFINRELAYVKSKIGEVECAALVTCVDVMVRVKLVKTERKQITVTFQFPNGYPRNPVLFELKSDVMSLKLLDGLSKIMEEEAKKLIGQYHIMHLVRFVNKFIDDNPLCVCSDEISSIKKNILGARDELKLKQKSSQVLFKLHEKEYFLHLKCTIPNDYPNELTQVEVTNTNFPDMLKVNFSTQCIEIARKCVEPPLRKKPKDPPFKPKPSLYELAEYVIKDIVRKYPHEVCKLCGELCLPENPANVVNTAGADMFVERIYCTDLFHHKCMDVYMKTPPFQGGKKCPGCSKRIYHDKWHISPELAEARWAHKEAKHRELDEVVDFFQ